MWRFALKPVGSSFYSLSGVFVCLVSVFNMNNKASALFSSEQNPKKRRKSMKTLPSAVQGLTHLPDQTRPRLENNTVMI